MALTKTDNPVHKPKEIKSWAGMDNRLDVHALDATRDRNALLRDAVNVSFDASGRPRLRTGRTKVYSGTNCRSITRAGEKFLFAEGTSLKMFDPDNNATTVKATGLNPTKPVAIVEVNEEFYWSDGESTGKVDDVRWGLPLAAAPILTPSSFGGLDAGQYHVAVTNLYGAEESGAPRMYPVTVADNGGIIVSGLTGTSKVYVTMCNGLVPLAHGTTTASTYTIGRSATLGDQIKTIGFYPFPPCTQLAYWNGRILGASGPFVFMSAALQYRLCQVAKDFQMFASDVTLIAPVTDGVFMADGSETWWIPRGDDGNVFWGRVRKLPYPAIPGTFTRLAHTQDEVAWFTPRGWVKGQTGGQVSNISENNVAIADIITRGAGVYREQDGRRELISSLAKGGFREGTVAGDYASAEVFRNGRRVS